MENKDIINLLYETLKDRGIWFTTDIDYTFGKKDCYKLNEFGKLANEKEENKVVKEINNYIGDGAADVYEAIECWIENGLIEDFSINYTDQLHMDFEDEPIIDGIKASEVDLEKRGGPGVVSSVDVTKGPEIITESKGEELDKEHDAYLKRMNKQLKNFCDALEIDKKDLDEILFALDDMEGQFGDENGAYQELREFIYNELLEGKQYNTSAKTKIQEDFTDKGIVTIEIGLSDKATGEILDSVIGQLSDGIWENTPSMKKYWMFMDVDKSGSEVKVTFNTSDYRSGFYGKDIKQIREWLANKIKQIVKEEELEWDRNNTEVSNYLDRGKGTNVTVQDAYRVYDKLKGRIDRIEPKTESVKELEETKKAEFILSPANRARIKELENGSAFTWEGMDTSYENLEAITEYFKKNTPNIKLPITFYTWTGKEFNEMYGLTGSNAYPDDINFVSIALDNWDGLGALPMIKFQVGARWLDDIVDNNAVRQGNVTENKKLNEVLEHNLSKDLFGAEAERRDIQKQKEYERDLQYVKDIMAGKKVIDDKYHEELSLETAKKWLRDDYIYINNLYSYDTDEINKRLAKDLPEIFGEKQEENFFMDQIKDAVKDNIELGSTVLGGLASAGLLASEETKESDNKLEEAEDTIEDIEDEEIEDEIKEDNIDEEEITDEEIDTSVAPQDKLKQRTQDLYNLLTDNGLDVEVSIDNGENEVSVVLNQQGGKIIIPVRDDNELVPVTGGNITLNNESLETLDKVKELLGGEEI